MAEMRWPEPPGAGLAAFEVAALVRRIDIGCADDEHGLLQEVRLHLGAWLAEADMFAGDTRTPPYDYSELVAAVDAALAARPRYILQETLAVAVAARVLANPRVAVLDMHLAKTERYPGCAWIGMRHRFTRASLRALAPRYADDAALQALAASAAA